MTSSSGEPVTESAAPPQTAYELAKAIRKREISPVEAIEWSLEAARRLNPVLHAYLAVDEEGALEAARVAEHAVLEGDRELGPLHGVPVSVKDLEMTKGLASTSGATAFRDFVPEEDTVLVQRLRQSGAIIIGKTNTPAFGLLGETKNKLGDDCRNPWDTTRTTGGSSGGSAAAVAAGISPIATGTDSAGSINCPAGMCGVYGIKPTHGRIPVIPHGEDSLLFNDGGPLARSVTDAALVISVLAGYDVRDPVALSDAVPDLVASSEGELAPLRIAWSPDAGHYAVETELVDLAASGAQAFAELGSEPVAESPNVGNPWESYMPLYITDARVALGDFLEQHPEDVFPETTDEIASVPPLSAEDYVRAYAKLLQFRSSMAEFFQRFDLLLTPTTAVSAFPCGEPPTVIGGRRVRSGWTSFMPFQIMWNMTGQPAASVPVGFSSEGLPVGMMIVGPVGREDLVLAASAAFERCRPWAQHVPPISAHR